MRDGRDISGHRAVTLRVTGPDMRPSRVPTVDFLRLAHRYYDLLQKASETPLTFTGIEIRDESVGCRANASSVEGARLAQQTLSAHLQSSTRGEALSGLDDFRRSMRQLPPDARVVAHIGHDDTVELGIGEGLRSAPAPRYADSLLTLRCRVLQANYERETIRLDHVFDRQRLCLEADLETLQKLSTYGGLEVDITAVIQVNEDGRFKPLRGRATNGRLEAFEPLVEGDAVEAWRAWYAENEAEVEAWLSDE